MNRPKSSFWNLPQTIRAPKSQKWPQNWVISNVRIKGNIENESYSTTWVNPKTVFETELKKT